MNRFEQILGTAREAKIHYMNGEYQVRKTGDFVRCAVTGKPIALADLRYWSVEMAWQMAPLVTLLQEQTTSSSSISILTS